MTMEMALLVGGDMDSFFEAFSALPDGEREEMRQLISRRARSARERLRLASERDPLNPCAPLDQSPQSL